MLFVDYVFETAKNGILFDKELKPDVLGVATGDMFQVLIDDNNRICFVKVKVDDNNG